MRKGRVSHLETGNTVSKRRKALYFHRLDTKRLIIGITGATGTIFGVRMLEILQGSDVETHLIVSKWGARTLAYETDYDLDRVKEMATAAHAPGDQGAAVSSGSFTTEGMVIAPCSMKTLSAIAHGQGDNLINRAADVVIKERRKLVLMVREAPLSEIHPENMLKLSRMGVLIYPPMAGFYNHPRTLGDMVDHIVMRVLDQFGLHLDLAERWTGDMSTPVESA